MPVPDRVGLKPGTVLVREWEGTPQRVMVLADGFAWNGDTYTSLSKVARAITGTRWNGPRFFGLRDQKASEAMTKPSPRRSAARSTPASRPTTGSSRTSTRSMRSARRREAYVKSQAHEGWRLIKETSTMAASRADRSRGPPCSASGAIRSKLIDVVVVYKVDRLTRSLADFAKLVEIFDAHGVSFVSVTQSFNTTTSMGRLTLNMLLSFAQFEREVTGERIRDKLAASKRRGIWVGGIVPLGYAVRERKLVIREDEAQTVRLIFERYLALGSLPALQRELRERGIVTRRRTLSSGRIIGGVPLTNGPLAHILRNRVYLGELNHKGASYPGEHAPIIPPALFDAVQEKLTANRNGTRLRRAASGALLMGRIFDDRGNRMTPSTAKKGSVRYRYYVSSVLAQGRRSEAGAIARVSASETEACRRGCPAGRIPGGCRPYERELIEARVERVVVGAGTSSSIRARTRNRSRSPGRPRPGRPA